MVNYCAVCGCCTRTDIVREHLEDTLRIGDVSAKGLLPKTKLLLFSRPYIFVNVLIFNNFNYVLKA